MPVTTGRLAGERRHALPSMVEGLMPLTIDGTLYYTTTEAARELGVQPGAVRDAVARGVIAVRHVEEIDRNLIALQDLERYRAERAGQQGWAARKDPTYQPTDSRAAYFREYRRRRRQEAAEQAQAHEQTQTHSTTEAGEEHQ